MDAKQETIWMRWMHHLFLLIENEKLTDHNAEKVLRKMVEEFQDPYTVAFENDLFSSGTDADTVIDEVLEQNQDAVNDYRSGKPEALNHLVGECVKKSDGRIGGSEARELLLSRIEQE